MPTTKRRNWFSWDIIDDKAFNEGEAIKTMYSIRPRGISRQSKIKFSSRDGLANKLVRRRSKK